MTLQINRPTGIFLAIIWLTTLYAAHRIGRQSSPGAAAAVRSDRTPENLLQNHTSSPLAEFNDTRKSSNENRFITFAQSLGGDELARLLPEMTNKMDTGQTLTTLARLLDEVGPGPARRTARFELVARWVQLDPAAAFTHIGDLRDPKLRHDMKLRGVKALASVNPALALAYADEAGDLPAAAREAAWTGFTTTRDLNAAFGFIPALESGVFDPASDSPWDIPTAVAALYQNDDIAVATWVANLEPGGVRNQAITGMIDPWAKHDPQAAARWIRKYADSSNRTGAYLKLGESWVGHDPEGAIEWVESLPPSTPDHYRILETVRRLAPAAQQ